MDTLLTQLGPRLRAARQAANLTVREAGERLGVDHSMIVRYENGESLPPLDRLIALADLYGLTPAALLARHAATVPLIAAIDRAEEDGIARLAALLDASDDGL
jgi:transcriptional regulator with XRE-family HTH domain